MMVWLIVGVFHKFNLNIHKIEGSMPYFKAKDIGASSKTIGLVWTQEMMIRRQDHAICFHKKGRL